MERLNLKYKKVKPNIKRRVIIVTTPLPIKLPKVTGHDIIENPDFKNPVKGWWEGSHRGSIKRRFILRPKSSGASTVYSPKKKVVSLDTPSRGSQLYKLRCNRKF